MIAQVFISIYFVHASDVFAQLMYSLAMNAAVQCNCERESGLNVSGVMVHVYNYESNSSHVYSIDESLNKTFQRNYFNENRCVEIYVPGFNTPINHNTIASVKCVFSQMLCNNKHIIAIIINHYEYTKASANLFIGYKTAVKYVKSIGIKLGELLVGLLDIPFINISITGQSLGAHMIGYAAEIVKAARGPLPYIYVLDPAGPCFSDCLQEHVRSGQANTVVAIHCTNVEGTTIDVADYDFYANDGETQPGCTGKVGCSHAICVTIGILPSIRENIWVATRCSTYTDYKNGKCTSNDALLAGYKKIPTATVGKYYFTTDNLTCNLI